MSNRLLSNKEIRAAFTAKGQVQGVGFRPFIYRLALELSLTGKVGNTSDGVLIEVQGDKSRVDAFEQRLRSELPPLARMTGLSRKEIETVAGEEVFSIVKSSGHRGHSVLISPDVGICDECLAEMRDPSSRRWRYPFTNCTACGPRFTITKSIPYDRPTTSMACFPLCEDCAKEYSNPLDRRFHAQPVACPVCGPSLWFFEKESNGSWPKDCRPNEAFLAQVAKRAAQALLDGKILAIRGLGGFQLACDARQESTVAILRERKHRPHKAFALMASDVKAIEEYCFVSPEEALLLQSQPRPVVVMQKKEAELSPSLAPDTASLGVMLPTTPLHVLLFDLLEEQSQREGRKRPVLVMTSGNVSGDPICLSNREAIGRLGEIADAFVCHNRDILCRVDDSVVGLVPQKEKSAYVWFRRARGYVPAPISLRGEETACVFGAGAGLKATCCYTRGNEAFVGQHTGDLDNAATAGFYEEAAVHLGKLLEVEPKLAVADLHPDFYSTSYAKNLAEKLGCPFIQMQHHLSHACSVLGEHGRFKQTLVLTLDGTGLGTDGTIWGGELLRVSLEKAEWERLGSLSSFPLPGGDGAVRNPWRIALALAWQSKNEELLEEWGKQQGFGAKAVLEMLNRSFNTPLTSSCGRLFDAVSAQLDICQSTSYEGQAAIRLEREALKADPEEIEKLKEEEFPCIADGNLLRLDSKSLFKRAVKVCQTHGKELAALDFHKNLAKGLANLASTARRGEEAIALSGGCMQNRLLLRELCKELEQAGFEVLLQQSLPAGDGGLSFGQAVWGSRLLALGKV